MIPFNPSSTPSSAYPSVSVSFASFFSTVPLTPQVRPNTDLALRAVPVYFVLPSAVSGVVVRLKVKDSSFRQGQDFQTGKFYYAISDSRGICTFKVFSSSLLFRYGVLAPVYELVCESLDIYKLFWVPLDGGNVAEFDLLSKDLWQKRVQEELNFHYSF